jgi:hypothetical protein
MLNLVVAHQVLFVAWVLMGVASFVFLWHGFPIALIASNI